MRVGFGIVGLLVFVLGTRVVAEGGPTWAGTILVVVGAVMIAAAIGGAIFDERPRR